MNVTNNEESDDVLYDIREREFDFFINFAMPYMFLALGKFLKKSSRNNEISVFWRFWKFADNYPVMWSACDKRLDVCYFLLGSFCFTGQVVSILK